MASFWISSGFIKKALMPMDLDLAGVGAQVHHNLMNLGRVGVDNANFFRDVRLDGDGGGQGGAQQLDGLFDDRSDQNRFFL